MMIRTYKELCELSTFEERFRYLKLGGKIGEETFGFDRIVNQRFYTSREWKSLRNEIIVRDFGCDLGIEERPIFSKVVIHHMNPISIDDINNLSDYLLNPEYLICTSSTTHNAIHYGDESILDGGPIERLPNDTKLW